jgi:hypothetical protein
MAELREQGEPILLTDLEPPSVPPEENGFEILLKASEILEEENEQGGSLSELLWDLGTGLSLSPEEREQLIWELFRHDQWERLDDLVTEAAARPIVLVPYIEQTTEKIYVSERLDFFRSMAIAVSSMFDVGKPEQAVDLLMRCIRIEDRMVTQGLLIDVLVDLAQKEILLERVEEGWRMDGIYRTEDLLHLQNWIASSRELDIDGMIRSERLYMTSFLQEDPDLERMAGLVLFFGVDSWEALLGLLKPYLKTCLPEAWALLENSVPQMKLPAFQRDGSLETLTEKCPFWDQVISPFLLSNMLSVLEKMDRHHARLQVAQLGIQLELHRRETGSVPSDILNMPESQQVDPFTGDPMKYFLSDGRPVIYSVGPNGRDDGGVQDERHTGERDDISWGLSPAASTEES